MLSIPSPRHAGQPAFLSRRQSREVHFAHSCENICNGDQLLLLCLCHLSHCALTLAEPVGEKPREVRAGKEKEQAVFCNLLPGWQAGAVIWQAWRNSTPACFAFIATPLPAALSLLLPEPLVHGHRVCSAGKGTDRMRMGKATLGMSQPHTSLLPLPELYEPGPYPQEGSESLMQSSGWQELGVQTGNIPAEEEK